VVRPIDKLSLDSLITFVCYSRHQSCTRRREGRQEYIQDLFRLVQRQHQYPIILGGHSRSSSIWARDAGFMSGRLIFQPALLHSSSVFVSSSPSMQVMTTYAEIWNLVRLGVLKQACDRWSWLVTLSGELCGL